MAGYVVLGKYTKQGLDELKDMPDIIAKHKEHCEKKGMRLIGTWCTMGAYDFVSVYESPNETLMAEAILDAARSGLVTTETMRAFSEEEFGKVVAALE